jgi:hypothetical protein
MVRVIDNTKWNERRKQVRRTLEGFMKEVGKITRTPKSTTITSNSQ